MDACPLKMDRKSFLKRKLKFLIIWRISVRCGTEEKRMSDCAIPTGKYSGSSILVCDCFCAQQTVDLIRIGRIMRKDQYKVILETNFISFGLNSIVFASIFQQGNVPNHSSGL